MALKREMKINIGPDGNITIEVIGVGGPECLEFSEFLEQELGEVVERERTAEFYQQSDMGQHVVVGGDDDQED